VDQCFHLQNMQGNNGRGMGMERTWTWILALSTLVEAMGIKPRVSSGVALGLWGCCWTLEDVCTWVYVWLRGEHNMICWPKQGERRIWYVQTLGSGLVKLERRWMAWQATISGIGEVYFALRVGKREGSGEKDRRTRLYLGPSRKG